MEALGMGLFVIGLIISFIGGIWLLMVAFQESVLWGLGCLLVPLVSLFFVVIHWDKAAKPFLVSLAALVPMVGGMLISNAAR